MQPDVVVCSGDLTTFGYKQEYTQARSYLDRLELPDVITIPGNHDSRNVACRGDVGPRSTGACAGTLHHVRGYRLLPATSTTAWWAQPLRLDRGAVPAPSRVRATHHLLPIPGGRERNVVHDAGDTLEVLQRAKVNLVLSGHKHVPYAGGCRTCSLSMPAPSCPPRACYNVVEIGDDLVDIYRRYPYHDRETIIRFSAPARWPTRSTHPSAGAADAPAGCSRWWTASTTRRWCGLRSSRPPRRPTLSRRRCGGTEKLAGDPDYGVPLETLSGRRRRLEGELCPPRRRPPVRPAGAERAAAAVAGRECPRRRAGLRGRRLRAAPARGGAARAVPALAIVGTGKRVGKTAVSAHAMCGWWWWRWAAEPEWRRRPTDSSACSSCGSARVPACTRPPTSSRTPCWRASPPSARAAAVAACRGGTRVPVLPGRSTSIPTPVGRKLRVAVPLRADRTGAGHVGSSPRR